MSNQKYCDKELVWNGERWPYDRIAEKLGVSLDTIYHRVRRRGWTVEEIITTPKGRSPERLVNQERKEKRRAVNARRESCIDEFGYYPTVRHAMSMKWVGARNGA